VRALLAAHREKQDLISIGAYQAGTDPHVDRAIERRPAIEGFLRQRVEERSTAVEADALLHEVVGGGHAQAAGGVAMPEAAVATVAPGPSAIPPLHLSV
jgi:flagellum-specific ATP synthase